MHLNRLTLHDQGLFTGFLRLTRHELSVYTFENIYIWKNLFQINWAVLKDSLCIFFRDRTGCFLYLAPLAKRINPEAVEEAFQIMDKFNNHKDISRIENIEERDRDFYQRQGYAVIPKFSEYLCRRTELTRLPGNKFKSQRASLNYFTKHYSFEYLAFSGQDKTGCLKLYAAWARERKERNPDRVYQGMLEDSRKSLEILLEDYAKLEIVGRIVRIDGRLQAFTFGFRLNPETFCVLYEITNLAIKGLAQFIFNKLCRELAEYSYVNVMDDSGLENLKKTKLSYRPVRLVPAYIARRKECPAT